MKKNDNGNQEVPNDDKSDTRNRRENLRRILVGGGVIGSSSVLPEKWSKAVVQSVVLPAHAQSTRVFASIFSGQGPVP